MFLISLILGFEMHREQDSNEMADRLRRKREIQIKYMSRPGNGFKCVIKHDQILSF